MLSLLAFFAVPVIRFTPTDCSKLLSTMEAIRVDKTLKEPVKIDLILELRKFYVSQSCVKPIF
jgi:hypothetical protein